jgi:Ni,Fe-hydrogenase maturation factor
MTLVIGIGNADRGYDAVGVAVARRVRSAALPGVTVAELEGDQFALLDLRDRLPGRLVGYGIEGTAFELGTGLSPQAAAAAESVIARLLRELGAG